MYVEVFDKFKEGDYAMISIERSAGSIEISKEYFARLIGFAASECFGVSGMVPSSPNQELRAFFRKNDVDKGVAVKSVNGKLHIELHIEVTYGVNVAAIVKSIINKVRYTVEEATGLRVGKVNVFVDSMTLDATPASKGE